MKWRNFIFNNRIKIKNDSLNNEEKLEFKMLSKQSVFAGNMEKVMKHQYKSFTRLKIRALCEAKGKGGEKLFWSFVCGNKKD